MTAAVIAYTRKALETACRTAACLTETETTVYTLPRFLTHACIDGCLLPESGSVRAIPVNDNKFYMKLFQDSDLLIFVSALGIAVRKIAPYVKDKKEDPAVLCMDEQGYYVISVLSGHIGGANEAARKIADQLGAQAVITTATDVNHRFSVDAWASQKGLIIDDMKAAKAVSAAILEQDIPMLCEPPLTLAGLRLDAEADAPACEAAAGGMSVGIGSSLSGILAVSSQEDVSGFSVGIYVGWKRMSPFPTTLRLIPRVIHLGIGCRRSTSCEQIERAVHEVFEAHQIDVRAVRGVYSINLKKDEQGLLEYCRKHGWQIRTYSAEELLAVEGAFSSSGFVQSVTGVDNVCERAAMKEADSLLIRKQAADGVTVAAAVESAAALQG